MLSTLLSVALLATPPAGGAATEPKPSAPEGLVAISTPDEARQLCRAVTPPDRLAFEGSSVERSDAARAHEEGRDAALQGRYRVTVPAKGLAFAPYDSDENTLALWSHAVPSGADGAARLALVEDQGLPVKADPATARRLVAAQQEGTLALHVTFVLAEDDAPCFALAGAPASTFAAEPVAWQYVAGDEVLARGGQDADRPLVSAAKGARPRVELGKPVDEGGAFEVRTTAPEHVRELEGCYSEALKRDPYLDGAIVVALQPLAGTERVKIAADSVQDEAFVGCVRGVLARVDVNGAGRTWLPIHFVLEGPPEADQQIQQ
jgi:hypothetical protein